MSVAILVPCCGPVDPKVFQSALAMAAATSEQKIDQVGVTNRVLVDEARQWLAEGFLQTDCEWAFWMDADMILEPRSINVLLSWAKKLDAKMLTGIYYQRQGNHKPIIWRRDGQYAEGDDYSHNTVIPPPGVKDPFVIHCAGFGCMLIHRDVFTEVAKEGKPWFTHVWYSVNGNGERKKSSEDFYFCVKARKAGFKLWAVPELRCGQY